MASGIEILSVRGPGGTLDNNASGRLVLPRICSREIAGITYQVTAYIAQNGYLVVGWRAYPFGAWTLYRYDGSDKTNLGTVIADPHYAAAVAIDGDGLVHVAWGMHNDLLRYRRSDAALGTWTGGVTAAQSMLGTNENSVTYPMFFVSPIGGLYFTFRDGSSGSGDQYLYTWDDSTDTWGAAVGTTGKLINGKSSSINAYLCGQPKFSPDWNGAGVGKMLVSWMWRDTSDPTTGHDFGATFWDGTNWTQASGAAQTIPITDSNFDNAFPISTNNGVICGDCDLNSAGDPVIGGLAYGAGTTITQLYAIYRAGAAWTQTQITNYASDWVLTSDWVLPVVLIDTGDDVCRILQGDTGDDPNKIKEFTSGPGDYSTWSEDVFYSQTGYGSSNPIADQNLWERDRVYSLFVPQGQNAASLGYIKIIEQRPARYTSPTFPNDWPINYKLTVDHTKVGAAGVTYFSVLLTRDCFDSDLFDPTGNFRAQSDGGDLVFTSDATGTNRLACHVVSCSYDSSSAAGDAEVEIYVKLPAISGSTDTEFYVWGGAVGSTVWQPGAGGTYGQYAAYDSRPIFCPLSKRLDSVSQDQIFCNRDSVPSYVSGKVLKGTNLSGASTQGIKFENPGITTSSAFSVAAWVNETSGGAVRIAFSSDQSSVAANRCFDLFVNASNKPVFQRIDTGGTVRAVTGTTTMLSAGWKRMWGTFDTTVGTALFVDGTSEGTPDSNTTANHSPTDKARIGYALGSSAYPWVGDLDGIELHTVRRDQDWVTTDFNNQNSPGTFITSSPGVRNATPNPIVATWLIPIPVMSGGIQASVSVTPSPVVITWLIPEVPDFENAIPRELYVLDHSLPLTVMTEKDTTEQVMYSLTIPANRLLRRSTLRITAIVSRVQEDQECCLDTCSPTVEDATAFFFTKDCQQSDCQIGQSAQVAFAGATVNGGPLIRIPVNTSYTNFTGYGAIYKPGSSTLNLVRWKNQDLHYMGTILGSTSATLGTSDVVKLTTSTGSENDYVIKVNGITRVGPITDTQISTAAPCVGFVSGVI